MKRAERDRGARDPSPVEIRKMCAKIREGWDERTHRLRAGQAREMVDSLVTWTVPECRLDDITANVEEANAPLRGAA